MPPMGLRPCLHSQPGRHPGDEVLRPHLPQQHRVLRRPRPLCLLLPGQPVQPQWGVGSGGWSWGPVGQHLCKPAVGAALGSLVSPVPTGQPWGSCVPSQTRLRLHVACVQSARLPAHPTVAGRTLILPVTPPCFSRLLLQGGMLSLVPGNPPMWEMQGASLPKAPNLRGPSALQEC